MGIGQTKQAKLGHWAQKTDRNVSIEQIKQTEMPALSRQNKQKCGYWADKTQKC